MDTEVEVSDATLSKQLSVLEKEGFVERFREYGSARHKDVVWVMLTSRGKSAFDEHVAALRQIAGE